MNILCFITSFTSILWWPVKTEYHIFTMLIWSSFVNILCLTPNISSQHIKMIKPGPSIVNEVMLIKLSHFMCIWDSCLILLSQRFPGYKISFLWLCHLYYIQYHVWYMANILTPQTWVHVTLIGEKVLDNSKWRTTLYMLFAIGIKFAEY